MQNFFKNYAKIWVRNRVSQFCCDRRYAGDEQEGSKPQQSGASGSRNMKDYMARTDKMFSLMPGMF